MSTTLSGRVITVLLIQNTGTPEGGPELDISQFVTSLGEVSWSVDEQLTKLSLGSLSISATDDEAGTVTSFIENSLESTYGLLPPWIILLVDGVQKFIGLVKEAPSRSEDQSSLEIQINAVDWSSMLESKRIDSDWERDFYRLGAASSAGPTCVAKSVYNKELRRGHDRTTVAVSVADGAYFNVGDWVYFANYSGFTQYNKQYPVVAKQTMDVGGLGTMTCLYLGGGFWWSEKPGDPQNYGQTSECYRVYTSAANDPTPYFVASESWSSSAAGSSPKTTISLVSTGSSLGVGGLQAGDILDKVVSVLNPSDSSFSVTVVDVDPVENVVYLDAPLSNDLVAGVTTFKLNSESLAESVLVPIKNLVERALLGLATPDWSGYVRGALPSPCLSFISGASPTGQNTRTETLSWAQDIQVSLTGWEVQGVAGQAWAGSPDDGWVTTTWSKVVSWTDQLADPPARLMPYLAPPEGHTSTQRGHTKFPGLAGDDTGIDPADAPSSDQSLRYVYDYSAFRCYQFTHTGSWLVSVKTWNGTAWTNVAGFSSTGLGSPAQIVPFADVATSVGSGYGLLGLYPSGQIKTLLSTVTLTAQLSGSDVLDDQGRLQAVLRQTSAGLYYVTPTGYGRIRVVAGVLTSSWVQIINSETPKSMMSVTPLTSTFVAASGRIITLAKVSYRNSVTDDRPVEDTYLLQLDQEIQENAQDSVISVDRICANIPRATMAVRSPVSEDILGFMGGRLFVISKRLPEVVERFNAVNQPASAVIEFVCAMTNTVAAPTVDGRLRIISRGHQGSTVNIRPDLVSVRTSRWNKHLASCVVVTGADQEKKGVAVSQTQRSGLTISYQNDVYIRNSSQAQAIAESWLAFFEVPRHEVEQVWFSQEVPAPWEALDPLQVITVGDDPRRYYLVGLSHNLEAQTATATLLEVVP